MSYILCTVYRSEINSDFVQDDKVLVSTLNKKSKKVLDKREILALTIKRT